MSKLAPILFTGGRLIDPAAGLDQTGDLLVVDGKIAETGPAATAAAPAECRVFDLAGKWLVPGLIDMHVHLREPGQEYKETVVSGTRAAAAGGFTGVACMPNTVPVNDCRAVTALILEQAGTASARVYPVGAISRGSKGTELAEFGEMKDAGVVALSDDGMPVISSQLMRRALEYSASHDFLIISHSEEMGLSGSGSMNEGRLSTRLGLRGIPRVAEEIMVYRDISLAGYTGRPVHIAHISTRESVALVRRAKKQGVDVTCETAPHYFSLTEEAVSDYDTRAKMNPPLRTADDVAAIIEGLGDGVIDVIATDHAPHSVIEKDLEFDQAANGIIGLETAVPLTLNLVRKGMLDPLAMVRLLSTNPARILGVAGGSLARGAAADLAVIDPDLKFIYSEDMVVSRSHNSPFLDQRLQGKAVMTVLAGDFTHNDLEPAKS